MAVEVLGIRAVHADEELRAARVLAGMGHRQHAAVVILAGRRGLALDRVAGASGAVAARAAALDDEIGDDPMESEAVVKSVFGQFDEVGHGAGRLGRVEFGLHHPFLRCDNRVLHGFVI